jgi:hypothetical protein
MERFILAGQRTFGWTSRQAISVFLEKRGEFGENGRPRVSGSGVIRINLMDELVIVVRLMLINIRGLPGNRI